MEHESGSHISLHESVIEDMERKIGNEKKNIQNAKAAYRRILNDLIFYKFLNFKSKMRKRRERILLMVTNIKLIAEKKFKKK